MGLGCVQRALELVGEHADQIIAVGADNDLVDDVAEYRLGKIELAAQLP